MSVSPSEAVSGGSAAFSLVSHPAVAVGFDLQKAVCTPEGFGKLLDSFGDKPGVRERMYGKLDGFFSRQQEFVLKCLASAGASARRSAAASAAGSVARASVEERLARSGSSSRVSVASRASSWRAKMRVPDGLCYMKMLKRDSLESVTATLQEWPELGGLLRAPWRNFEPMDVLERFRLEEVPGGLHVSPGGSAGVPLMSGLARVAGLMDCPEGSLGSVVSACGYDVEGAKLLSSVLLPSTRVGGRAVPPAAVVECPGEPGAGAAVPVFLAGSDGAGRCWRWRDAMAGAMAGLPCDLLSPACAWPEGAEADLENEWFRQKLAWEYKWMSGASVVFFYFQPGTSSACSMMELGLLARSRKLVVCCPPGFGRRANVEFLCREYGAPCFPDLGSAVARLRQEVERLAAFGGSSSSGQPGVWWAAPPGSTLGAGHPVEYPVCSEGEPVERPDGTVVRVVSTGVLGYDTTERYTALTVSGPAVLRVPEGCSALCGAGQPGGGPGAVVFPPGPGCVALRSSRPLSSFSVSVVMGVGL